MKNSLFKRVAAAATAVPLALTQCLTFSSAAEGIDAVQVGNSVQAITDQEISLENLLRVEPGQKESNWNKKLITAVEQKVGFDGTFDASSYADQIAKQAGSDIAKTVSTFLGEYVLATPVKYVINEDKNIVLNITVTQPNWNESLAYTPQEALELLAKANGVVELESVDFSSVKLAGTVEIVIDTQKLEVGTDVPFHVTFKPDGEKEFNISELPAYLKGKVEALRALGNQSIDDNYTGYLTAYKAETHDKFNEKVDLIISKINRAENAMNKAVNSSKEVSYDSVSEALTAANNFLAKKNIKRQLPTSATGIASTEAVKKAFNNVLTTIGSGSNVTVTAEQLGQFVDALGSKSLTEADGTVVATDFNIKANNKSAELVGAFDDAEADEVKDWVENQGYKYIGSYKKLTGKLNFKGIDTFDIGDVDVKIERILVTDTTEATTTTTSDTTSETTTETTATTSETTDTTSATTETSTETTSTTSETTSATTETSTETTSTTSDTTSATTETSTETTSTTSETTSETTETSTETTSTTSETTSVSTETSTETTSTTSETKSVSTETSTETTSTSTDTTTSTDTDTTTTSTDTTSTSTETTTTTTVTIPDDVVTTSVVESVYVDIDSTYGFYFNTETSFDAGQIKKATLHTVYGIGYTKDGKTVIVEEFETTEDVTGKLGFGTATPANTYKKVENKFDYDVQIRYEGETIIDKDGNQVIAKDTLMRDKDSNIATVLAYIGVKGDVTLNNIVDGNDATATLTYYTKTSTNGNSADNIALSTNETLVNGDAKSVYDSFAAFLGDVKYDADSKVSRFAKKGERVVDGRDATSIHTFYTKSSTDALSQQAAEDPESVWNIVLGNEE